MFKFCPSPVDNIPLRSSWSTRVDYISSPPVVPDTGQWAALGPQFVLQNRSKPFRWGGWTLNWRAVNSFCSANSPFLISRASNCTITFKWKKKAHRLSFATVYNSICHSTLTKGVRERVGAVNWLFIFILPAAATHAMCIICFKGTTCGRGVQVYRK